MKMVVKFCLAFLDGMVFGRNEDWAAEVNKKLILGLCPQRRIYCRLRQQQHRPKLQPSGAMVGQASRMDLGATCCRKYCT